MGRSSRKKRNAIVARDAASGPTPRREIVRIVALFVGLLVVFQVVYYELLVPSSLFRSYLAANGRAAATVLNLAGENVTLLDDRLFSTFAMSIKSGCDGIQAMAILAIAICVLPGAVRKRAIAIGGGIAMIATLNLLRLVSLFWAGVHAPAWFEPLHVHIWPAALVFAAMVYVAGWTLRTNRAVSTA